MTVRNTLTRTAVPLALALSLAGLAACSSDTGEPGKLDESRIETTLADVAGETPGMSQVTDALDDTGLESVLDGKGSYTLLAPTDKAFDALGDDKDRLTGDGQKPLLAAVLRDHLVPGVMTPDSIRDAIAQAGGSVSMRTLGSGSVSFAEKDGELVITGADGKTAHIAGTAYATSNGVLIPVDSLLVGLPEAS